MKENENENKIKNENKFKNKNKIQKEQKRNVIEDDREYWFLCCDENNKLKNNENKIKQK